MIDTDDIIINLHDDVMHHKELSTNRYLSETTRSCLYERTAKLLCILQNDITNIGLDEIKSPV